MHSIPLSMWTGVGLTAFVMAALGAFVAKPEWPRHQQVFVCAVVLAIAGLLVGGYNDFGFVFHAADVEESGGVAGWNDSVTASGWTRVSAQQRWKVRRAGFVKTLIAGGAAALGGMVYAEVRRGMKEANEPDPPSDG